MEVRESFIFHSEYIEDLPEENKAEFLVYIYNYAIKGIEPELSSFAKTAWIKIKRRIDMEREQYEKKCSNLKQRQANKEQMKKTPDTDKASSDTENNLSDTEKALSETEKTIPDGEYESEFVNEFESETERESEFIPKTAPSRESPSATDYSNKIFKIFQEAGLPCARDNPISFLQRDFKNAMAYLHKTPGLNNLHSDDVIAAARNYAKTVTDPESYITGKYSFDRFVTFKNFVDFLPENYTPDNFKTTRSGKSPEAKPRREWMDTCPACKKKSLAYDNAKQKYVCTDCGREFEYEEVNK